MTTKKILFPKVIFLETIDFPPFGECFLSCFIGISQNILVLQPQCDLLRFICNSVCISSIPLINEIFHLVHLCQVWSIFPRKQQLLSCLNYNVRVSNSGHPLLLTGGVYVTVFDVHLNGVVIGRSWVILRVQQSQWLQRDTDILYMYA